MASIDEVKQAKIAVTLDGTDANAKFKELTATVDKYTDALLAAYKAGDNKAMKEAADNLKQTEKQLESFKKQTFDTQKVLNDLSGSSVKDLKRAFRELNSEMESGVFGKRGSDQWNSAKENLEKLKTEIDSTKQNSTESGFSFKRMWEMAGGVGIANLAEKALGLLKDGFMKVVESSKGLSDNYEFSMKAMKNASDEFFHTIANGDWSNLFTNMAKATAAGYKYAEAMDGVNEKARSLKIMEAELTMQNEIDTRVYKDATRSKEDRLAAIDRIMEREKKLSDVERQVTYESYYADVNEAKRKTGLAQAQLEQYLKTIAQDQKLMESAKDYNKALDEQARLKKEINTGGTTTTMTTSAGVTSQFVPYTKEQLDKKKEELSSFTSFLTDNAGKVQQFAKVVKTVENNLADSGGTTGNIQVLNDKLVAYSQANYKFFEDTKKMYTKRQALVAGLETDGIKEVKKEEDKNAKLIESQKAYIDEINNLGETATQKEEGEYLNRLKKAGLFNKAVKDMTVAEKQAQEILFNQHSENMAAIAQKEADDELKIKKEATKKLVEGINQAQVEKLNALELEENATILAEGKTAADRDRIHNEYNKKRLESELQHDMAVRQILIAAGESTVEIDKKIGADQIKAYEEGSKELEKLLKEREDLKNKYGNGGEGVPKYETDAINELATLQTLYENKKITDEEYLSWKEAIEAEYNARHLESLSQNVQQALSVEKNISDAVTGFKDLQITKSQNANNKELKQLKDRQKAELAAAGDNEDAKKAINERYAAAETALVEKQQAEEKAIRKKYAGIEFAIKVSEIIANTAVAIMQGYAQLGPIGGTIAAIALGASGLMQLGIANEQRSAVMQAAKGKYDVIGADDGKTYKNVPLKQKLTSGLISSPTLVAEQPEVIMDIDTTRFAIMNYPQILSDIKYLQQGIVPQRAAGSYEAINTTASTNQQPITNNDALIQAFMSYLMKLENEGIPAYINWGLNDTINLNKEQAKIQYIEDKAKRS